MRRSSFTADTEPSRRASVNTGADSVIIAAERLREGEVIGYKVTTYTIPILEPQTLAITVNE